MNQLTGLFERGADALKMNQLISLLGGIPGVLLLLVFVVIPISIAIYDLTQKKHAIRRNFPVIGMLRYALETVGPELRQYLFASDRDDRPIPRYMRAWIYASSKKMTATVAFGTRKDMDKPGTILMRHSAFPVLDVEPTQPRVVVGERTPNPYEASVFNISAMSFGSLGAHAITALSQGAKMAGCFHNTGEGSVSPYHLKGGADICWQIGTGKFGCRTADGGFDPELFGEMASREQIKMIEIKLSQGAKPGKGGVLPGEKVTAEIAATRKVPVGKSVLSPTRHREWDDIRGMLEWIDMTRGISKKPTGVKFCLVNPAFVEDMCQEMINTGILLDFITVDGAEGGTGASPLAMTDYLGYPLHDGLMIVDNALRRHGLREKIRVIASGKVFTGAQLAIVAALGADMANSARGFMLSIGCIHALRCNTNHCPAGVATQSKWLQRGLVPEVKAPRVANYHAAVIHELNLVLHACGKTHLNQLERGDVMKMVDFNKLVSMDELVPYDAVPHMRPREKDPVTIKEEKAG